MAASPMITSESTSSSSLRNRQHFLGLRMSVAAFLVMTTLLMAGSGDAIDLMKLLDQKQRSFKRAGEPCHPYEPFKCPGDGACISIQYLCDGAADCPDGYDEDLRLCTAAKRPPVEETASFLQALISSHGPDFLEKLFGAKARNALEPLGGVERVAIALSESQTIGDFGSALRLMRSDLEHLRSIFAGIQSGDMTALASLGIKDAELGDVKFFLEKLIKTGFLD
ncbi:IDLSRF-like peptide [Daphnia pulicaria]|uniref:IDLSRF-like peptide n=1 Tax=Daphnia pulicaria TaxID=35523 RepID=UPI001EEC6678|nr:IDLSRF-like peptide [Daphnia pulicaria]